MDLDPAEPSARPDGVDVGDIVRALLGEAAARLTAAGARDEALAEYIGRRRRFLVPREPVMVPVGRAWRLGVLLIDADGAAFATGSTTRAVDPGRRGYTSESARDRAEYRAAAARGRFPEGETVNFGWRALDLDDASLRASSGPIVVVDGVPVVRWGQGSAIPTPLRDYLDDRVGLLVDPPAGA
ncbi:hypothetical protein ELQ90_05210 [Labedella phragmitis]|uniref:Glutaminase n=1 Tax=Labedella phragmitis TaxID=2498849 RepID=A0A444PUH3_9MICO|nr:hypothetical protein [Labedella phragmitis]RWZ51513.1 hypothetical protein ELQ90_05210 [Labedella phragmitis]